VRRKGSISLFIHIIKKSANRLLIQNAFSCADQSLCYAFLVFTRLSTISLIVATLHKSNPHISHLAYSDARSVVSSFLWAPWWQFEVGLWPLQYRQEPGRSCYSHLGQQSSILAKYYPFPYLICRALVPNILARSYLVIYGVVLRFSFGIFMFFDSLLPLAAAAATSPEWTISRAESPVTLSWSGFSPISISSSATAVSGSGSSGSYSGSSS